MVNCESQRTTKLVNIHSNPVSPKTEIEDALNGKLFVETLSSFKDEYPELLGFINEDIEVTHESTYFSLDLRTSEWRNINTFFDADNNKFRFAKKYSENITDEYVEPSWITEIRNMILPLE